ncbi:FG-GAP repeat protein, partial [Patescibacteria group bacterium]|nr:FG-GAP repeat protein [Patescibacteria group bacterium]
MKKIYRSFLFIIAITTAFFVSSNVGYAGFSPAASYGVGSHPRSVITADLDGDGDGDLAVANYSSNSVSVLFNNGDGIFAAAVNYGV